MHRSSIYTFQQDGRGQHTYRILFTVLDDQPIPTVRILHIRNAAQRAISEGVEGQRPKSR